MLARIARMIGEFETGRLTRRDLIAGLAALAAAGGAIGRAPAAGAPRGAFRAVGLNHIALNVTDVARSRAFYVEHLGLRVSSESRGSAFLRCGDQFVALFRSPDPGMDHYCYAVEGYDAGDAARRLEARGIRPRVTRDRIYFDDPDGLEVQLSSPGHGV